jgi:hypothetical protein
MRRASRHRVHIRASERHPEETISDAELRPPDRSSVHGQLVTQGEILERELARDGAADKKGENSKN